MLVIGFLTVGREAFTLAARPRQAVFDLDEAVDFVADHLPFEVSAELSYEDVRQLVGWHLAYLRERGVPAEAGSAATAGGPIVVADDESVDHVASVAGAAGLAVTRAQVQAVLDAELAYLDAIGAIGPAVEGPDDPG